MPVCCYCVGHESGFFVHFCHFCDYKLGGYWCHIQNAPMQWHFQTYFGQKMYIFIATSLNPKMSFRSALASALTSV